MKASVFQQTNVTDATSNDACCLALRPVSAIGSCPCLHIPANEGWGIQFKTDRQSLGCLYHSHEARSAADTDLSRDCSPHEPFRQLDEPQKRPMSLISLFLLDDRGMSLVECCHQTKSNTYVISNRPWRFMDIGLSLKSVTGVWTGAGPSANHTACCQGCTSCGIGCSSSSRGPCCHAMRRRSPGGTPTGVLIIL